MPPRDEILCIAEQESIDDVYARADGRCFAPNSPLQVHKKASDDDIDLHHEASNQMATTEGLNARRRCVSIVKG
eukprot:4684258-Prymnesium_polylepis.1